MQVKEVQAVEKQAATEVWQALNVRIRAFVQSRVRSTADADDIVQSVFLRIHQKLGSLRQEERLDAWVFQIARNAIADFYRSREQSTQREHSLQENQYLLSEKASGEENLNALVSSCLLACIDQLPQEQRRAVRMYELEGLSQREIASREGLSLSGIKSRIQRGREKLKRMLLTACKLEFDTRGNILNCGPETEDCECSTPEHDLAY